MNLAHFKLSRKQFYDIINFTLLEIYYLYTHTYMTTFTCIFNIINIKCYKFKN